MIEKRNLINKIKAKSPFFVLKQLYKIKRMIHPQRYKKFKNKFEKIFEENNLSSNINKKYINSWKNTFEDFMFFYPEKLDLVEAFAQHQIEPVQISQKVDSKDVSLICIVKDDLYRIKSLYRHYQSIGIKHFVFVDNNSNDGTREWLLKQDNTDVYLVTENYSSPRRCGWINQILNLYGFNKWYLVIDSDEFFVYEDMEQHSISSLVKHGEQENIHRLGSIMLDMYTKEGVFQTDTDMEDNYRYFDTDSYAAEKTFKGLELRGGPRARVMFNDTEAKDPLLTKYPLFFFREGDLYETSHFLYPYEKNSNIKSALLHYKFLESDLQKYQEIAQRGNFAKGSIEYKNYLKAFEENTNLTFMYEGSVEYKNSKSLKHIDFIEPINLDKK